MKKLLILIALPIFWGLNTYAQSTNLLWAKQMGVISDNNDYSIVVDVNGNIYTTGAFSGFFIYWHFIFIVFLYGD